MKPFAVVIAPSVHAQISEQMLFIARDSVDRAFAWEARVIAAIEHLGEIPGFAIDEQAANRLGCEVHKVVFERTYLIHYVIDEQVIRVIGFRHGARRPMPGEP